MAERTVQLILHYDGAAFAGWQRQPDVRTVQGSLEEALGRICGAPVAALGSGRTDAGVHARGQSVGVRVAPKWTAAELRRAVNAVLPHDIWIAGAFEMRPEFHARYSAVSRRYSYAVATDEAARSPFRRRWEWFLDRPLSRDALDATAQALIGEHCFRAFAVRGAAPDRHHHRCVVKTAEWRERPGGLEFNIEANRFLRQMVRFLVGTIVDMATGRREASTFDALLAADDNLGSSAPAPPHALYLESVVYPRDLYLGGE